AGRGGGGGGRGGGGRGGGAGGGGGGGSSWGARGGGRPPPPMDPETGAAVRATLHRRRRARDGHPRDARRGSSPCSPLSRQAGGRGTPHAVASGPAPRGRGTPARPSATHAPARSVSCASRDTRSGPCSSRSRCR